ncbi:MAG: exo-alpha-sialidase [Planctomycetes bacterium]|nr:exo-alpha-sialidase [Planctomycetota bacterium]
MGVDVRLISGLLSTVILRWFWVIIKCILGKFNSKDHSEFCNRNFNMTYSGKFEILRLLACFFMMLNFVLIGFSDENKIDDPGVFRAVVRKQGDEGVHTYRIPGLACSNKGTLLAVFDLRHKNSGDLPADVDVGLARSIDQGKTWQKNQVILDYDKNEKDSKGNGVGDPCILVDRKTGTIFVAALWSKGNRGWNGSGPGLSPEETGQFVITKSSDDGVTWSKPINITAKIKGRDAKWRLCFQGPGSGIQLKDGTLVFPAQYREASGIAHSCFIFSSDSGDTWTISSPAIPGKPPTSESQIAELNDGSLLLSMRDESRSGKRAWARFQPDSGLAGGKWVENWSVVDDPTCMASLIRHPDGLLFFSNPSSPKQRVALTVRASSDNGKTWSKGRLIDPRPSSYSSMTVLNDGSIGVLYECGPRSGIETLSFVRFRPEWILEGESKK